MINNTIQTKTQQTQHFSTTSIKHLTNDKQQDHSKHSTKHHRTLKQTNIQKTKATKKHNKHNIKHNKLFKCQQGPPNAHNKHNINIQKHLSKANTNIKHKWPRNTTHATLNHYRNI